MDNKILNYCKKNKYEVVKAVKGILIYVLEPDWIKTDRYFRKCGCNSSRIAWGNPGVQDLKIYHFEDIEN
jgi:hypothetical protein